MTGIDPGLLLDPHTPPGVCAAGLHDVTGADHAKPVPTPTGVVHVCVYCWQEAELRFMHHQGLPERLITARTLRHRQERAALIVDDVAVDRVVAGQAHYTTLTLREQHRMVRAVRERGWGAVTLQQWTGMNKRVSVRLRSTEFAPALQHWEQGMLNAMLSRQLVAA